MNTVEAIKGYEVNVTRSKSGKVVKACVMVGDDKPGMRLKDGRDAEVMRRQIRAEIAAYLGLAMKNVSASAKYNSLVQTEAGIVRRDGDKILGIYAPVGAPIGNKNAAKDELRDTSIHIACTRMEKAKWVKAARGPLPEWVRSSLNKAAAK